MSVIKKGYQIERIESQGLDLNLFKKRGSSKTFKGYLIQKMKEAREQRNFDVAQIIQHFYKKYLEFETSENIKINSWRGKGGISLFNKPDSIVIEFAGKRDKDEKPNIKKVEYSKENINKMIVCINKLKNDYENRIPSRALGELFFGGDWDINVFSKRTEHTKFTHLLNILDYYKIINYNRKGFVSVLNEVREIQGVLK